jgi:hypothetical protein
MGHNLTHTDIPYTLHTLPYRQILVIDFEFHAPPGERPDVACDRGPAPGTVTRRPFTTQPLCKYRSPIEIST